jgi:hypothetical protein
MATSKTGRSPGSAKTKPAKSAPTLDEKPVALTLKVDEKTYQRLSNVRGLQRRTNQAILREALEQYLDRVGA